MTPATVTTIACSQDRWFRVGCGRLTAMPLRASLSRCKFFTAQTIPAALLRIKRQARQGRMGGNRSQTTALASDPSRTSGALRSLEHPRVHSLRPTTHHELGVLGVLGV